MTSYLVVYLLAKNCVCMHAATLCAFSEQTQCSYCYATPRLGKHDQLSALLKRLLTMTLATLASPLM